MEKLLIVRHGKYVGRRLSDEGSQDITSLAQQFLSICQGKVVKLVSSTAGRASHSAEIIGETLSVPVELEALFWSDEDRRERPDEAVEFIQQHAGDCDVMIVVTHYEYTDTLPREFGQRVLGVEDFPRRTINKGHAWIIDCKEKTCEELWP